MWREWRFHAVDFKKVDTSHRLGFLEEEELSQPNVIVKARFLFSTFRSSIQGQTQ